MSVEHDHPYDILAMNGASAAIAVSDIPLPKHVGAVRIGKLDGDFVVNPAEEDSEDLDMDLVVSGTDEAILMVECGAEVRDRGRGARRPRHRPRRDQEDRRRRSTSWRRRPARRSVEVEVPQVDEELIERSSARTAPSSTRRPRSPRSSPARTRSTPSRRRSSRPTPRPARARRTDPERRAEVARAFAKLEKDIDPAPHRGRQEAPRRSRPGRDPADRVRGRHLSARPRLGAVHPRRDADPVERRAGHDPDGHEGRQPRPPGAQDVLPPLQLPAVLGGRGRLHARPEAPRHRPRRARRAGAPGDDPGRGGLPVRAPGRLRDARVERLVVDGLGLRLLDGAPGGAACRSPHRSRASRWG